MGSDLHIWTQAVCNSMQIGATLMQSTDKWAWNDAAFCKGTASAQPLSCYFNVQLECPESEKVSEKKIVWTNEYHQCPKYIHDMDSRQAFRAAAIEYLFSNLNPRLVEETEAAIKGVFGPEGIPQNMITLHQRLGDKYKEMKLVTQAEYVEAIDRIVIRHNMTSPHVYVTTESLEGIVTFRAEVKKRGKNWNIHHYAPAVYNSDTQTPPARMARNSQGGIGRHSLIALLLAMEGKYYVMTSGSNWSRLINELRKNVVDVDCNSCTECVDLREAFETQNWRGRT